MAKPSLIKELDFEAFIILREFAKNFKYKGRKMHLFGVRIDTLVSNPKCCHCGIEGDVWRLEYWMVTDPSQNGWMITFNLYNSEHNRLMTRDHIHPVSKGGENGPSNAQTLCVVCNNKKADHVEEAEEAQSPKSQDQGTSDSGDQGQEQRP